MEAFAKSKLKCFQSLFQCWKMFVSSYPWNNFLLYLLYVLLSRHLIMRHRILLILGGYVALHWMFLGVHIHYIK